MATQRQLLLEEIIAALELPDSAYEKAASRYKDLGDWFLREASSCRQHSPHIFPQGSFALGTAIRPLHDREEYDLDLSCKLREGITKTSHSQEGLKNLVGKELEAYRQARRIEEEKEEKRRCWRLIYQDNLSFHMDVVPCIPEDEARIKALFESIRVSESPEIADSASKTTTAITDNERQNYRSLSLDWNISNPQGYAVWFRARMVRVLQFAMDEALGRVEELPLYKQKTPLQRAIQILKRHRDTMFKDNPDAKPISIIITTLAARAYGGESDLESALTNILTKMGGLVRASAPRIPNPVDPGEDFADRWSMPGHSHLRLEENFWTWLRQAQRDFQSFETVGDSVFAASQIQEKFAARIDADRLRNKLGLKAVAANTISSPKHVISEPPPKPWKRD